MTDAPTANESLLRMIDQYDIAQGSESGNDLA